MSVLALVLMFVPRTFGGGFSFEDRLELDVDGVPWLATVTTPFGVGRREETYKVFTHIYDFEGQAPITKGAGGTYSHHRGLFIGWKDTIVKGNDYDTWHMSNCFQEHVRWIERTAGEHEASQTQEIFWIGEEEAPFIEERRRTTAHEVENGLRVFDFKSVLTSKAGRIKLRGNLHHAGMQVRMAEEVAAHPETTHYTLPEGARIKKDDKVVGTWWVCCSCVIRGTRYWVLHMTPRDHPSGCPVYSIRPYGRFGAFFEANIEEDAPLELDFRIVVSRTALAGEQCEALYAAYNAQRRE